ncbi:hypothetical protein AKO1_008656 [Acrasis kona]|uniref:DYW domain-containing protein n=1 Tax=Acrasis kona TaxID=1008807 RepID=A0AAW2ZCL2_9EUKA
MHIHYLVSEFKSPIPGYCISQLVKLYAYYRCFDDVMVLYKEFRRDPSVVGAVILAMAHDSKVVNSIYMEAYENDLLQHEDVFNAYLSYVHLTESQDLLFAYTELVNHGAEPSASSMVLLMSYVGRNTMGTETVNFVLNELMDRPHLYRLEECLVAAMQMLTFNDDEATAVELCQKNSHLPHIYDGYISAICKQPEINVSKIEHHLDALLKKSKPDLDTILSIVRAYRDTEQLEKCLPLLLKLEEYQVKAHPQVYAVMFLACTDRIMHKLGLAIYEMYLRSKTRSAAVENFIIRFFGYTGDTMKAVAVFESVLSRNETQPTTWEYTFRALSQSGMNEKALLMFEMMRSDHPEFIVSSTIQKILTVCVAGNLLHAGTSIFIHMKEEFGIVPVGDHYIQMIELYLNNNMYDDAHDLLQTVEKTCRPQHLFICYNSFMTYFYKKRNVEGAAEFLDKMAVIPGFENVVPYYTVLRLYEEKGMINEIEALRQKFGQEPLKKLKITVECGITNIQILGHEYQDDPHIREFLTVLFDRATFELGYEPDLSDSLKKKSNIKVEALWRSPDKVALAFGHLYTPVDRKIMISKSLRINNDNHQVYAIYSRLYKRDVIVKAKSISHFFRNGICSCGLSHEILEPYNLKFFHLKNSLDLESLALNK